MAQNNAVPEACDCAKKWVSIGLKSEVSVFSMAGLVFCRSIHVCAVRARVRVFANESSVTRTVMVRQNRVMVRHKTD